MDSLAKPEVLSMASAIVLIDEYGILVLLNFISKFASNVHNVSNMFDVLCSLQGQILCWCCMSTMTSLLTTPMNPDRSICQ